MADDPTRRGSPRRGALSRRAALSGAALVGIGAAADRAFGGALGGAREASTDDAIPFHGAHQAGIATPLQGHLHFAAFDVTADSRSGLRDLLVRWTAAARALTAGRPYDEGAGPSHAAAADPGEAAGLPPSQLTLTFGFGPSLFGASGRDRFGLARHRPRALRTLPPFPGEKLDPAHSYGDVCVQACANDPQVAFHAIHVLFQLAGSDVTMRWAQLGFARTPGRNLLGFKDGTNNLRARDGAALSRYVWARNPRWLDGGTYLVARRIDLVFEAWDALAVAEQERTIGRRKASGAPLGGHREHDAVDLRGSAVPPYAHIRLASAETNGGERLLRRSYSYSRGITPGALHRGGHQMDGGLFFIAFVRDPDRQFIPLQRRLATSDALSEFTVHTASAIFACPPGVRPGGYVGETLLG
jgi:deferrochelatase/peroxidase EfeB